MGVRNTIRIGVIGAGLAGLTTAYLLKKHRRDFGDDTEVEITVFEASNRVGGRVHTLRDFQDGLYAEAGAVSIADTEKEIISLVKELGLEIVPRPDREKKRFFRKGQWDSGEPISALMKIMLSEIQRLKSKKIIQQSDDWSTKDDQRLDALDQISIVDFFVNKGENADEVCTLLGASLLGPMTDDLNDLSALDALRFVSQYVGSRSVFSIKGGNDCLPHALENSLNQDKQCVFLNKPVQKVEFLSGWQQWSMMFQDGGVQMFDGVVMAVPLTALQTHRPNFIVLPLSKARQTAIDSIPYTQSVSRVYFEVNQRFWKNNATTAMTITDHPTLRIEDHTAIVHSDYAVIEAYASGKMGFDIQQEDSIQKAQSAIAYVYGEPFGQHTVPEKTVTMFWHQEPFQCGAYPYFKTGQRRCIAQLSKPINRLFFAGAFTAIDAPASMNGAVKSAYRVVENDVMPGIKATLSNQDNVRMPLGTQAIFTSGNDADLTSIEESVTE